MERTETYHYSIVSDKSKPYNKDREQQTAKADGVKLDGAQKGCISRKKWKKKSLETQAVNE